MFKMKTLVLACAAATATLASGIASAVVPGACGSAATSEVYLSGASAPQNILDNIMSNLLTAGFTVVGNAGSTNGANYRAYCGTLAAAQGTLPAGTSVRLVHRVKGGSLWGVSPVATNSAIATLSLADTDCSAGSGTFAFLCNEVGDDFNTADPKNRVPDFGVSDMEPSIFTLNINTGDANAAPVIKTPLTSTDLSNLQISRGFIAGFGIAVTDTVPLAFNFTRANIASILTGQTTKWNNFGAGTTTATNDRIVICRREAGSGTQATSNQFYLDNPCANGNVGNPIITVPLTQTAVNGGGSGTVALPFILNPNSGLGAFVIEAPSTGDVRDCLKNARIGADWTFTGGDGKTYKAAFSTGGKTYGAIGVLGLENQNNSSASIGTGAGPTAPIMFRAINGQPVGGFGFGATGATPARNAIQLGAYENAFENTFQYNKTNDVAGSDYTVNRLPVINAFIGAAEKETTLQVLSDTNETAVLAIPGLNGNVAATAVTVPTALNTNNAGTAAWSKGGNNCSPFRAQK